VATARPWLGRAGRAQQLLLAWTLNAVYFIALAVWAGAREGAGSAAFWERNLVDFCLSQTLILPVGLWFFAWQESVLRLAGLPVAQEPAGNP
jgi:hypothetical protein